MSLAVEDLTVMKEPGVVTPPLRSLAIVGSHPDSRENAPFDDPNYEIFLFNEAPQKPEIYKRWDTCLQIHLPEVYTSETNWVNKDHWKWLQQDHGPDKRIFMQEVDPRVPNSVRYPYEDVRSLVPYKYLRSSPAMALALAIHLGYKDISIYGSDLSSNTEYHFQAINYAFWIGFAHGRGINLDMQCWRSEFFEQPIYGYEGELQLERDHFLKCFEEHQEVFTRKDNACNKLRSKLDLAILDNEFDRAGELSLALENALINTGEAFGAMKEAERYADRTDHISRQEFERVSAQAQLDGEEFEKNMNHAGGKCEYVWNVWMQTGALEAKNQFRTFIKEKNEHAWDMGKSLGIFRENLAYQHEYDQRVTAAGGPRAVAQTLGNKA
jgi:hypothetical protein